MHFDDSQSNGTICSPHRGVVISVYYVSIGESNPTSRSAIPLFFLCSSIPDRISLGKTSGRYTVEIEASRRNAVAMRETTKQVDTALIVWDDNTVERRLLVQKAVIPERGVQQGNIPLDIGVSTAHQHSVIRTCQRDGCARLRLPTLRRCRS